MKLVVWWCIPCKGIMPIFVEYAKNFGTVRFIVEKEISENRKKLGWEVQKYDGEFSIESLEHKNWSTIVDNIFNEEKESVHIFNGIRTFPKVYYALKIANSLNLKHGILAEVPHNPYKGIKKILKFFYTGYITPYLTKSYSKKADFYFSASGEAKEKMLQLGWEDHKIFPYGYFTEMVNPNVVIKTTGRIKLICTGYITKNKGHILLLKALNHLGEKYSKRLELNITGFGPERETLEKYVADHNIKNINFLGVVKTEKLEELMAESNILVAPGFEEPWGIRINEAIMYELPVISSDGIGASQVIEDLECGLVFRSGSYLDLSNCLLNYLDKESLYEEHLENIKQSKENISPLRAATYLSETLNLIYRLKELQKNKPWVNEF